MLKMRVQALMPGGVTLRQCRPASVVTWMLPSPVPAQITFVVMGEGASAVMVPCALGCTSAAYLPAFAGTAQSAPLLRSGLMRVQECAPSVVFHTTLLA